MYVVHAQEAIRMGNIETGLSSLSEFVSIPPRLRIP
jgi:hypothetical protein